MRTTQTALRRLAPALAATAALGLAACGGDDSNDTSAATTASSSGDTPVLADDAELKQVINVAYGRDADPKEISPPVLEALKVAGAPVTPEIEKQLLECLRKPTCETGRGELTIGVAMNSLATKGDVDQQAGFILQALRYPNVKKIITTNANNDPATSMSNFRSLISQKADAIVGLFTAGATLLPVAKQATKAGVKVVASNQPIPGAKNGTDILSFVGSDACAWGTQLGEQAIKASDGKQGGSVAMYSGPAGNPYAATWQPCTKKALEKANWKVAVSGSTDWTPQGEQQAATALQASGKKVDAIIYDFTPQALLRGYTEKGQKPPTLLAGAGTAGYFKAVDEAKEKGIDVDAFISNSTGWATAVSITAAMDALAGKDVPAEITIPNDVVPLDNVRPQYDPSQPEGQQMNLLLPLELSNRIGELSK